MCLQDPRAAPRAQIPPAVADGKQDISAGGARGAKAAKGSPPESDRRSSRSQRRRRGRNSGGHQTQAHAKGAYLAADESEKDSEDDEETRQPPRPRGMSESAYRDLCGMFKSLCAACAV
jgi:hypothetical protein